MESIRKNVFSEFHKQVKLRGGETIAMAYSAGKDSSLTLHLLNEIIGPRRDVTLRAIIIDEGIAGYRDSGIERAHDFCRKLGIDLVRVSFEERFGNTLDEIVQIPREKSACTYCGVLRRKLLNSAARELGADYLATGHNLDDTVQGIVMNIFRGDIEKLARMGPHESVQEGLVPRIQPLRRIPEKEVHLYCLLSNLNVHEGDCPYAAEAVRNTYREMVAKIEEKHPGTRYSILSSYESIRDALRRANPPMNLNQCGCGEPSVRAKCKACELLDEIALEKRKIVQA